MKKLNILLLLLLFTLVFSLVNSTTFTDTTQDDFDAGTHTGTETVNAEDVNGVGLLDDNTYGEFISSVKNAGSSTAWNTVEWKRDQPPVDFNVFHTDQNSMGGSTNKIDRADFDNDGDLDLIILSAYRIYIAMNDGSGNFTKTLFVNDMLKRLSGWGSYDVFGGIKTTDFDKDNDADFVATTTNGVYWYENNDSAVFSKHTVDINLASNYAGCDNIQVADADGDNDLDIFAICNSNLFNHINNGNGTFSVSRVHDFNADIGDYNVVDFDKDGYNDILVVTGYSTYVFGEWPDQQWILNNTLLFLKNNGAGSFTEYSFSDTNYDYDVAGAAVEAVDIDNDSDLDILVHYINHGYSDYGSLLVLNLGWPDYNVTNLGSTCAGSVWKVEDLDNANGPDIVCMAYSANNQVDLNWLENDGAGSFTRHNTILGIGIPESLGKAMFSIADFNGDSKKDLAIIEDPDPSGDTHSSLHVFRNLGNQTFSGTEVFHGYSNNLQSVDVNDFDGDGDNDFLFVDHDLNKIVWYSRTALGNLVVNEVPHTIKYPDIAIADDLDGDSQIDFAVSSSDNNQLSWFENNGSGSFTQHDINSGHQIALTYIVDIDSDGSKDLLTVDRYGSGWYENNGSGSFSYHKIPNTEFGSAYALGSAVFAADLDGDTDTDIFSGSGGSLFYWLENNGSESFTGHNIDLGTVDSSPITIYFAFPADVDSDGDTDVAAVVAYALWSSNRYAFAWFENDGTGTFPLNYIVQDYSSYPLCMLPGDFDSDGNMDFMGYTQVGTYLSGESSYLKNNGDQNFTRFYLKDNVLLDGATYDGIGIAGVPYPVPPITILPSVTLLPINMSGLAVDDVDKDGDPDLVQFSHYSQDVGWFDVIPVNSDVNLQISSCAQSNCSDASFVGPDGTATSYFTTPDSVADISSVVSQNQYFAYKTYLRSSSVGVSPYLTFAEVITPDPTLDVNLNFIDSNPFSATMPLFSYTQDGNLTIDFNAYDGIGGAITADINYSAQNTQGTGTSLVSGLDLNASGYCGASPDFSSVTECSYDFNIHSSLVSDGNYYIIINLSEGSSSSFKSSDKNFMIDNTAPTVSITLPVEGSRQSATSAILTYTGSDVSSGIKNYWVKIDSDGWIDNSTALTYTFDSLASGNHTIYVIATDNADNNSTTASVTFSVTSETGGNTCEELGGYICIPPSVCPGEWLDASDTSYCCSLPCVVPATEPDLWAEVFSDVAYHYNDIVTVLFHVHNSGTSIDTPFRIQLMEGTRELGEKIIYSLGQDDYFTDYFEFIYDPDDAEMAHWIGNSIEFTLTVDSSNTVDESDETNNIATTSSYFQGPEICDDGIDNDLDGLIDEGCIADLAVLNPLLHDYNLSESRLDYASFSFSVRASDRDVTDSFSIGYYLRNLESSTIGEDFVESLSLYETLDFEKEFQNQSLLFSEVNELLLQGTERIYIFVDYLNEIFESNELNNIVHLPFTDEICYDRIDNDGDGLVDEDCEEICYNGIDDDLDGLIDEGCLLLPDLTFWNVEVPSRISTGSPLVISAYVRNQGISDAEAFTTKFYFTEREAEFNTDLLSTNESERLEYEFSTAGLQGTYELRLVADSSNTVEESNEQNNIYTQMIEVLLPRFKVDLNYNNTEFLGDEREIRVYTYDDEPVEKAEVEITTPSGKKLNLITDSQGIVSFLLEEHGLFHISVTKYLFEPYRNKFAVPKLLVFYESRLKVGDHQVVIVETANGHRVPNATVEIITPSGRVVSLTTDSQGRANLRIRESGIFDFSVSRKEVFVDSKEFLAYDILQSIISSLGGSSGLLATSIQDAFWLVILILALSSASAYLFYRSYPEFSKRKFFGKLPPHKDWARFAISAPFLLIPVVVMLFSFVFAFAIAIFEISFVVGLRYLLKKKSSAINVRGPK